MFKNKLKATAIALTAVFLVGCTDITVSPTDNDDKILNNLVTDLEKNVNSVVYDALRDGGNLTQRTLEDVMFLIAENRLGTLPNISDLVEPIDPTDTPLVKQLKRQINVKMYDLIASGQFETRNLFSEERFAFSIEKQLYELNRNPNSPWVVDFVFPPRNTEAIESGDVLDDAIHLEYYQDFIEKNLLPKIYRELLVEKYLIDNDYSSLGRSYARKVNYVALKVSSEYPEAVKYLMDTFIDQYILDEDATEIADLELLARAWRGIDPSTAAKNRQYKFDSNSPEYKLLDDAGLVGVGVYRTLYGEVLERFSKIVPGNPLLTDKAIESEFTGNGQYTPEIGLGIRRNELIKRDFTTDGWHVKNGGLGSLPASIRDRIFNIGVANAVDRIDDQMLIKGTWEANATYAIGDFVTYNDVSYRTIKATTAGINPTDLTYFIQATPQISDFLKKINGVSYLIPQTSQQNDGRNFLLYDANSATYYIVQVLEAVNTTKMNASSSSTTNYNSIVNDNGEKRTLIAGEIARILGVREASINASNLHWLKLADLKFHDQTIYDFFKERFPSLYDEDAEDTDEEVVA
jgi:hypothetical protein